MSKQRTGLGRGIDALIDTETVNTSGSSSINDVEIKLITPNPNQPRTYFDEDALSELSKSISELGVISPITLRKNDDGTYQIIAGERRYRAAKKIGLPSIPAYIRTAADEQVMEMALIENIQREDLNAIEIALTFYRLIEEYKLTQERLSDRVGKSRESVTNYLRLLKLPAEIQMGIKDKKIDMGHARAILGLENPAEQLSLYEDIQNHKYSVRKVEELVRQKKNDETKSENAETESVKLADLKEYDDMTDHLEKLFGKKIRFACNNKGKGYITIPFANDDELTSIMEILDKID
ncbi:MAG: ParB/RepB/Spo0J family partition protein [Paludibacter sp.]|jgi:ParB family chromosome partitioning protein|nr:ParB/RepB/Spo0J family partition protein [Paludibacter sp.]